MRRAFKWILIAASISASTLSASVSSAWGELGHGTVGYIAEKYLTPQAKGLVFSIIGSEPLAIAALWPDQIKFDERYRAFGVFHYLDLPYEYTFSTLPPNLRAETDAATLISQAPALLTSTRVSREQKMILLRYLAHVVGDVHQPVHIGNGFDRGATLCDVIWRNPETGRVELNNVHEAWDNSFINYIAEDFKRGKSSPGGGMKPRFGFKELAEVIMKDPKPGASVVNKNGFDFASANRVPVNEWYTETRNLHAEAYPDKVPVKRPEDRLYCKTEDKQTHRVVIGKYDSSKVPQMDDAYIRKSVGIAKGQILLAGYRLAGILNQAANGSSGQMTPAAEAKMLSQLLLKNAPGRNPQGTQKSDEKPAPAAPVLDYHDDHEH